MYANKYRVTVSPEKEGSGVSEELRRITHYRLVCATLCVVSILIFAACSNYNNASNTTIVQPTSTTSIVSPTMLVSPAQSTDVVSIPSAAPTVHSVIVPSPTSSTTCSGHQDGNVCIIDPDHLLVGQPVGPDALTPMSHDMAQSLFYGTVTVSQKYGMLHFVITGPVTSDECKAHIFMAFSVTEDDYVFPQTHITCQAGTTILDATLTAETAKKIDWDTQLDVADESSIAWNQYDTHTP